MEFDDALDLNIGLGLVDDVEMSDDELKKELQLLDEEEELEKKINSENHNNLKTISKMDEVHEELSNVVGHKDEKNQKNEVNVDLKNDVHSTDKKLLKKQDNFNGYLEKADMVRNKDMFKDNLIDFRRLSLHLDVSKDSDPMVVGREIAYRLHEPKSKLLGSVVRVLGVELCLEIFNETKKIVKKGGLKTDNGERKRSPGGTFLYILKNRGYASASQMKEIFKYEEHARKKAKKHKYKSERVVSKYS